MFTVQEPETMLSERTRNTLVGLTMLLSLAVLMYGILLLGRLPMWGGLRPYILTLETPNANGVVIGAKVDLNGVAVGQVNSVSLVKDSQGKLIAKVVLTIDGSTDIPT